MTVVNADDGARSRSGGPDVVTLLRLVVSGVVVWLAALGGRWLLLSRPWSPGLSSLVDSIDGAVAVLTGDRSTRFGAVLGSVVDRLSVPLPRGAVARRRAGLPPALYRVADCRSTRRRGRPPYGDGRHQRPHDRRAATQSHRRRDVPARPPGITRRPASLWASLPFASCAIAAIPRQARAGRRPPPPRLIALPAPRSRLRQTGQEIPRPLRRVGLT